MKHIDDCPEIQGYYQLPGPVKNLGRKEKSSKDNADDPIYFPMFEVNGRQGMWSGEAYGFPAPPPVGTKLQVTMNSLVSGAVRGYFTEYGYIGLDVELTGERPGWYKTQSEEPRAFVYGAEVRPQEEHVSTMCG